jgi:predicted nucleotidyltransferase component of viral defense system
MAGMTLYWEATPPSVQETLRRLSRALTGSDFYLAGGTALALQFGHRMSIDLDVFSPSLTDADELASRLGSELRGLEVTSTAKRTVEATLAGVPISLFGYTYPLVAPLVTPEPGLLPLASIDDIAAMKLAAIASRGSRKDFVDLWLILHQVRSVEQCLDAFARKFATRDLGHVVRSLTYFDDAEGEPPLRLLIDVTWQQVRDDITRAASGLFER